MMDNLCFLGVRSTPGDCQVLGKEQKAMMAQSSNVGSTT